MTQKANKRNRELLMGLNNSRALSALHEKQRAGDWIGHWILVRKAFEERGLDALTT
jgi:hypothetical protein